MDNDPIAVAHIQINLFCDDVPACLGFYRSLGLPEVFRFPASGAVEHAEVDAAGTRLGLTSAAAANRIAGLGVGTGGGRSSEVVLWSQDVDGLFARAVSAGAAAVAGPMDSPDGRLRYAWVLDPAGHQVKLVQAR
ncbi:Glyoxalase/bleomycin resistance protein/dioxygenase [Sinomonas atrocyanea]|uniref:Glyoxalase/bleomycin resistance protein/dioxygenase n=1 Tax=Sinomonas atrocyanea TaxID=37927 RepID=A0A127A481_9MICC|nr:VOC family protein [Sinomonas atrocyanea]AMM32452.1 Glyoxalase/bleomycin resistance protein/dioxygenase [Sinomonas atrocyanea]GEB63555.1 hypothetical protein SAT01_10030 [Sinomonas atrocyanea]GGG60005.1 hypothetical protein GCM10007172_08560 [Sinomonas atrocyanea]